MDTVLGIDVGASQFMVARASGAALRFLPEASETTNVWVSPHGPVADSALGTPDECCSRWLWLLGRGARDADALWLAASEGLSVSNDGRGGLTVALRGDAFSPVTLGQMALAHCLAQAVRSDPGAGESAVIVVPSGFDAEQTEAVKSAARLAGIDVDRVLRDTTAVAIGALEAAFEGTALVIHLGAGHAEAAIVDAAPGILQVVARASDAYGGADTLDYRLTDWLLESIEHETGERPEGLRWRAFMLAQIRLLRQLNFVDRTVSVPFLAGVGQHTADATWELSNGWIRNASKPMADRLTKLCRKVFEDSGLEASDLDRVLVVGEGAQIERVQAQLKATFPKGYFEGDANLGAMGAAHHGACLRGVGALRLIHEERTVTLDEPSTEGSSRSQPPSRAPSTESHAVFSGESARPSAQAIPAAPRLPDVSPRALLSSRPPPGSVAPSAVEPSASSRPSSMAPMVPRSGKFRGATTVDQVRSMPLATAPTADYAPPYHLAFVLIGLSNQRDLTGKITLRHRTDSVEIMVYQGSPTLTSGERSRIPRAFLWAEGEYAFTPEPVVPSQNREREPMLTLVAACIKPMLRGLNMQDILDSFGPNLEKAPVISAERHTRVQRLALTQIETRMVEHDFQGKQSLREMVESSPLGRQSLIVLIFVMELFGALQWPEAVRPAHLQPLALLEKEVGRLRTKNHFEVLGAHWSSSSALLKETHQKFCEEFGPNSRWHKVSPALCAEALAMGNTAWKFLSTDSNRLAYRKSSYPDIDTELLAPLLASRAKSLAMRGDTEGVNEMSQLIKELSPAQAMELRSQLAVDMPRERPSTSPPTPPPGTRPPGKP